MYTCTIKIVTSASFKLTAIIPQYSLLKNTRGNTTANYQAYGDKAI